MAKSNDPVWLVRLKWAATFCMILAGVEASLVLSPLNYFSAMVGTFMWAIVGVHWNEKTVIVLNSVMFGLALTSSITNWPGIFG